MLAGQEALAKQIGGISMKGEEEALYANKIRWNSKQQIVAGYKRNEDKTKRDQSEGSARTRGTSKIHGYTSLRGNVTIVARRVIWRKCASQGKGLWRVMLLPPELKKNRMLRR